MYNKQVLLFSKEYSDELRSHLLEAEFVMVWQRDLEKCKEFVLNNPLDYLILDLTGNSFWQNTFELEKFIEHTPELRPNLKILVLFSEEQSAFFSTFESSIQNKLLKRENWISEVVIWLQTFSTKKSISDELLLNAYQLNEQFFQRLTQLARQLQALKEREDYKNQSLQEDVCSVLIVETSGWFSDFLKEKPIGNFITEQALGGGIALDKASRKNFQLMVVQEDLVDLPGTLVLQNFLEQNPDALGILFSPPLHKRGNALVKRGTQFIPLISELAQPIQLLKCIEELCQVQIQRKKERRYLLSFRKENQELLKKYRLLHQKMEQYFERK